MNLLGNGINKKKWTIIILAVIIVIAISLFLIFKGNKGQEENEQPQNNQTENNDNYTGHGGGLPIIGRDDKDQDEDIDIVVPTEEDKGVIKQYNDFSSYAELTITTEGKDVTFKLTPNGIVYDAKTNKVLYPSELKSKGEVKVLYSAGNISGVEQAEVVIKNADKDLQYTPTMSVVTFNDEVYVINEQTKTKYRVYSDTKLTNALSGGVYNKKDLKTGDRLFVYTGTPEPAKPIVIEEDEVSTPIQEDYFNAEKVESPSEYKDYKHVETKEIYVYPYNK